MPSPEEPQLNPTEQPTTSPDSATEASPVSFDDLLDIVHDPEVAQVETVETDKESGESGKPPLKEASPETAGRQEMTLEEKIEQAKQTAYDDAYRSYEILSDQDVAAAKLEELEHTDPHKRTQEEQKFMSVAGNILPTERRQGHGDPSSGPSWQEVRYDFPQFGGRMFKEGEGSVDTPSQYIPAVIDAVESYLPLIEKDKKPEERAATEEQARTALQKSVEGFTKAAFNNDDLEVVLQGLEYLEALDDPENLKKLKERMVALKSSEKPEDKEKLSKAATMLREIQERKTSKTESTQS